MEVEAGELQQVWGQPRLYVKTVSVLHPLRRQTLAELLRAEAGPEQKTR